MPPSLADWVADDHLVWTVLGAVERMDLTSFYGAYRANGQGRAAYDPGMMVALLMYAYARGNRSSRGIERACREDVDVQGDHGVARCLITRRSRSFAGAMRPRSASCSSRCSRFARRLGLVSVGVIAIDGTKIKASASRDQNRSYARDRRGDPR